MSLRRLLDILIPRFMTENAAVDNTYCDHCDNPHLVAICCMDDVEPGEEFEGIVTMSFFNLFGFALFPKQVGDVRPWVNPHDEVKA